MAIVMTTWHCLESYWHKAILLNAPFHHSVSGAANKCLTCSTWVFPRQKAILNISHIAAEIKSKNCKRVQFYSNTIAEIFSCQSSRHRHREKKTWRDLFNLETMIQPLKCHSIWWRFTHTAGRGVCENIMRGGVPVQKVLYFDKIHSVELFTIIFYDTTNGSIFYVKLLANSSSSEIFSISISRNWFGHAALLADVLKASSGTRCFSCM